MRPHPLLAITSAIFIIGGAGVIGDATTTAQASALASVHRHATSARHATRVHLLAANLTRRASALIVGTYKTAPLPYLFASSPNRPRHFRATKRALAFEVSEASGPKWQALRECESDNNYGENNGNGYYGAYQFAPTTWWGLGYSGLPSSASPALQDAAAVRLEHAAGWSAWPICSEVVGL